MPFQFISVACIYTSSSITVLRLPASINDTANTFRHRSRPRSHIRSEASPPTLAIRTHRSPSSRNIAIYTPNNLQHKQSLCFPVLPWITMRYGPLFLFLPMTTTSPSSVAPFPFPLPPPPAFFCLCSNYPDLYLWILVLLLSPFLSLFVVGTARRFCIFSSVANNGLPPPPSTFLLSLTSIPSPTTACRTVPSTIIRRRLLVPGRRVKDA